MTIVPIITTSIGRVIQQHYEFRKSLTHQNFTTCYVAAVHDSIYNVSCSDFNRAVQVFRTEHGRIAEGMWKQAAVTTCALISCNIYVYTDINNCAFECSVSVRNLTSLVHANCLIYAALLYFTKPRLKFLT
jgi:hypothetical protein